MVWAWVSPPEEEDPFWISQNYELSTLTIFQCPSESDLDTATIYFDAKRYSRRKIESYSCLNIAASDRVINQDLCDILFDLVDKDEAIFHPVCIQTKDGETNSFYVVIIKNCLPCLNPEKSNIRSWVVEQEFTIDYDGITFKEGCLGNLDIAADTMTGRIIVSNRLKEALTKTQLKGLYFSQGVDLHM